MLEEWSKGKVSGIVEEMNCEQNKTLIYIVLTNNWNPWQTSKTLWKQRFPHLIMIPNQNSKSHTEAAPRLTMYTYVSLDGCMDACTWKANKFSKLQCLMSTKKRLAIANWPKNIVTWSKHQELQVGSEDQSIIEIRDISRFGIRLRNISSKINPTGWPRVSTTAIWEVF